MRSLPARVVELADVDVAAFCVGPADEPEAATVDVEGDVLVTLDAVEDVESGEVLTGEVDTALVDATTALDPLYTDCDPPELPAFGHNAITPCPWKKSPIRVLGLASVP